MIFPAVYGIMYSKSNLAPMRGTRGFLVIFGCRWKRDISNAYKEITDIRWAGTLLRAGSSGSTALALVPDSGRAGCCKCKR